MEVLEQIGAVCNVSANAKNERDWELFLNAIYKAASILPIRQRMILLLAQEHGLSFSDIGRVMNLPHSTVMHNHSRAIDKIVLYLKKLSLINLRVREESKIAEEIYCEKFKPEEHNAKTRFGYYHGYEPPWFYHGANPLFDEDD